MSSRLASLLHPVCIAFAPLLLVAAANIAQIELSELLLPAVAVLALTLFMGSVSWLLLRSLEKAALLTSLSMSAFLLHGHLHGAIQAVALGFTSETVHLVMLLFWLISLGLAWFALARSQKAMTELTKLIFVVGVALLSIGMVQLTRGQLTKSAVAADVPAASVFTASELDQSDRITPIPNRELPDIYYLILDGYGRHDQLAKCYNFDNSVFLQSLEDSGFYVADRSHSNYAHTFLSLASSLNLRFVTPEVDQIRKYSEHERGPLYDLIRRHDLGRYLRKRGYRYIHFNSWWGGTASSDIADITIRDTSYAGTLGNTITRFIVADDLTEFHRVFMSTTMLGPIARLSGLDSAFARTGYRGNPDHLIRCFEELKEIPHMKVPTFAFAHFIIPHPPYFFDRDGNKLEPEDENPNDWTKRDAYVNQLIFLNSKLQEIVAAILANSDRDPIIILQADHGTCSLADWTRALKDQPELIEERMSILNAYYVPDEYRARLYSSISPVNTFRLLVNSVFQTNLSLLPDKVFFSWHPPYGFIDVTARLGDAEAEAR